MTPSYLGQLWNMKPEQIAAKLDEIIQERGMPQPPLDWADASHLPDIHVGEVTIGPKQILELMRLEYPRDTLHYLVSSAHEEFDRFATELLDQCVANGRKDHQRVLDMALLCRRPGGCLLRLCQELTGSPGADSGIIHNLTGAMMATPQKIEAGLLLMHLALRLPRGYERTYVISGATRVLSSHGYSTEEVEDASVPGLRGPMPEKPAEEARKLGKRWKEWFTAQRRWRPQPFQELIVQHPVSGKPARSIVWGAYANERLLAAFRIQDDGTYAGIDGAPVRLSDGDSIRIVHPAELTEQDVARWKALLKGNKPPFDQWAAHAAVASSEMPKTVTLPAATLMVRLEAQGWVREKPAGTVLRRHLRAFPQLNLTAVIEYPGIPLTHGEKWTEQTIERWYFVSGAHADGRIPPDSKPVSEAEAGAVAVSEVAGTLRALEAK